MEDPFLSFCVKKWPNWNQQKFIDCQKLLKIEKMSQIMPQNWLLDKFFWVWIFLQVGKEKFDLMTGGGDKIWSLEARGLRTLALEKHYVIRNYWFVLQMCWPKWPYILCWGLSKYLRDLEQLIRLLSLIIIIIVCMMARVTVYIYDSKLLVLFCCLLSWPDLKWLWAISAEQHAPY